MPSSLPKEEHRCWIGRAEEPVVVEINRRGIVKYSIATEQTQEKYLRGDEAPPMFVFNLSGPLHPLDRLRPVLPLSKPSANTPEGPLHRMLVVEVSPPLEPLLSQTATASPFACYRYGREMLVAAGVGVELQLGAELTAGREGAPCKCQLSARTAIQPRRERRALRRPPASSTGAVESCKDRRTSRPGCAGSSLESPASR